MSLPAVRSVRDAFPNSEIAVLARPWVGDLYARETSIDRVITYTPGPGARDLLAKWHFGLRLRREHFDLAILLQNAFEAAAIARLAGIPRVIGYQRDARGWLLTDAVPVPRPGEIPPHQRFYYLELLHRSGLLSALPSDGRIVLDGAADAARSGQAKFLAAGLDLPVIGVSPGAAYGTAKRWLPEHFAAAASELASRQVASVAVFGSAAEAVLCRQIATAIGPHARSFAGETSLRDFIDMAAACRLYLTNDSGAMHIASALGVPTVAVFGATDDAATGPTGPLARVVREPVECSPCLLRDCPIDHRCMTRVPAARVVSAAAELLSLEIHRGHA